MLKFRAKLVDKDNGKTLVVKRFLASHTDINEIMAIIDYLMNFIEKHTGMERKEILNALEESNLE